MTVNVEQTQEIFSRAQAEIAKVIIGQTDVVDKALITVFSGQHALVEGVPGVGKTLLVRTLAKVLGCEFMRIQFTPDLMPADITGTNVFNMKENDFRLMKGPIFTTFLLADEINRAPAKTQSALLQAMQERCVTIDRQTHSLSPNFTVFATQNPIEYEGTYPLPEAQKDRFLIKVNIDCPGEEDEIALAHRTLRRAESPEFILDNPSGDTTVQAVVSAGDLEEIRASLESVRLQDELVAYIVSIVRKTRQHSSVLVGAGPRATQALVLASRVSAVIQGRDFVTPDDIKDLSLAVLEHRLILRPEFEIEGLSCAEVVEQILRDVTVPR